MLLDLYNPVFQIHHNSKSGTKSPGFYLHDDIYFLDCPGVCDQESFREYPNITSEFFSPSNIHTRNNIAEKLFLELIEWIIIKENGMNILN